MSTQVERALSWDDEHDDEISEFEEALQAVRAIVRFSVALSAGGCAIRFVRACCARGWDCCFVDCLL